MPKRKAPGTLDLEDVTRRHVSRRLAVIGSMISTNVPQEMDIVQLAACKRELYTRLLDENHRLKIELGKARTRPAGPLTVAALEDLAIDNVSLKNELIRRLRA
jgi:hypothetical protein